LIQVYLILLGSRQPLKKRCKFKRLGQRVRPAKCLFYIELLLKRIAIALALTLIKTYSNRTGAPTITRRGYSVDVQLCE